MAVTTPVYLDNHATTRVDPRVVEAMDPWWSRDYGNAASTGHVFGWRAEEGVEAARETLAGALGARPRELVFTSGATEANNLALLGAAEASPQRDHLVTVATEHRAVLDPCRALAARGRRITVLPVDGEGLVDPEAVRAALTDRTLLVSVMAANNEIGVLQPLAEIGALCRERGVLLHTDAAQAFGKVPLDLEALGVDLASLSAHKLYGPKGVGALYVRRRRPRVRLEPRQYGGGHERGLRSGTLPVPLAVGFAKAAALCRAEGEAEAARLADLRDRLWERLRRDVPGVVLNGHPTRRLPGNLNVSFPDVDGERLLLALSDVALSSGSACTSAHPEPSHVLTALGRPEALVRASLRMGIGRFNTAEEVDYVAGVLAARVQGLRRGDARKPAPASLPSADPGGGRGGGREIVSGQQSTNITWHAGHVTRAERERLLGQKGVTVWLTGLSGSGKSTIATAAEQVLLQRGRLAYVLDGDNVRHGLNRNLGFSPEDRTENIRRIGEVAKLFTDAGVVVLTSFISPYRRDRDAVRAIMREGDFVEVYVAASVEACEGRDPKGLYKKARAGEIPEFTGISAPYEAPERPELVLDTEKQDVAESVARLVGHLEEKGYLSA